jgi:anti-anti-sigma factor
MFKYSLTQEADKANIVLHGDLDIDVTEMMEEEIAPQLMNFNHLEFDFSEVHFVDSSGIGILISLVQKLTDNGAKVRIDRLNEDVKLVFGMLQLPEILGPDVLVDFPQADTSR